MDPQGGRQTGKESSQLLYTTSPFGAIEYSIERKMVVVFDVISIAPEQRHSPHVIEQDPLVNAARADECGIQRFHDVGGHDDDSPGGIDNTVQHVQESLHSLQHGSKMLTVKVVAASARSRARRLGA